MFPVCGSKWSGCLQRPPHERAAKPTPVSPSTRVELRLLHCPPQLQARAQGPLCVFLPTVLSAAGASSARLAQCCPAACARAGSEVRILVSEAAAGSERARSGAESGATQLAEAGLPWPWDPLPNSLPGAAGPGDSGRGETWPPSQRKKVMGKSRLHIPSGAPSNCGERGFRERTHLGTGLLN